MAERNYVSEKQQQM